MGGESKNYVKNTLRRHHDVITYFHNVILLFLRQRLILMRLKPFFELKSPILSENEQIYHFCFYLFP